jgi:hypothetical protein
MGPRDACPKQSGVGTVLHRGVTDEPPRDGAFAHHTRVKLAMNRTARRSLIVGIALMSAFGASILWESRTPDLRRLYASGMERAQVPPVIIVPGILGSRLRERGSGRELWPGSAFNVLFSARSLALDIDPKTLEPRADDVEAYDLFRGLLLTDFYGEIIDTLER